MQGHEIRRANSPRLSVDSARRQGEVTRLAMLVLGREAAIAFMNEDNSSLGGRPIDLAVASEDGRRQIEAELARLTSVN